VSLDDRRAFEKAFGTSFMSLMARGRNVLGGKMLLPAEKHRSGREFRVCHFKRLLFPRSELNGKTWAP